LERTYDNPEFFKSYAFMSPDTILRDGRYLEEGDSEVGLEPMFEKARKPLAVFPESP
jgi:hypothetical protein